MCRVVWQVRGPEAGIISVDPQILTIGPCDTSGVTFRFSPLEQKDYSVKVVAVTTFKNLNIEKSAHRYKYAIKLYGHGGTGTIKVMHGYMYMDICTCTCTCML